MVDARKTPCTGHQSGWVFKVFALQTSVSGVSTDFFFGVLASWYGHCHVHVHDHGSMALYADRCLSLRTSMFFARIAFGRMNLLASKPAPPISCTSCLPTRQLWTTSGLFLLWNFRWYAETLFFPSFSFSLPLPVMV